MKTRGRIHSYEVGSTVDGPGLRFVVFMQGCPLRCSYCHNPDTCDPMKGEEVSVEELLHEINKYHSYMDHGHGGLTVSGGEPLLQAEFVATLFEAAQKQGIHTSLDTSGFGTLHQLEAVLPHTDLVLLDIKSSDPALYQKITHVDLQTTLRTAQMLEERRIPFWIRFVLVPGLTDSEAHIEALARLCAPYQSLERIEILPFHKLGAYKWKELGLPFSLDNTPPAGARDVERALAIFKRVFQEMPGSRLIPIL